MLIARSTRACLTAPSRLVVDSVIGGNAGPPPGAWVNRIAVSFVPPAQPSLGRSVRGRAWQSARARGRCGTPGDRGPGGSVGRSLDYR